MKNRLNARAKILIVVIIGILCIGLYYGINKRVNNKLPLVQQVKDLDTNSTVDKVEDSNEVVIVDNTKENQYAINVDVAAKGVDISDILYGLFFEDINFAADGGIYAELIKNRSFEYTEELANNGPLHGYTKYGDCDLEILDKDPLNVNNTHYLRIKNNSKEAAGFTNGGFLEGITLKEGETYQYTVYLKSADYRDGLTVKLLDKKNQEISVGIIPSITKEWTKYTVDLTANASIMNGKLMMTLDNNGTVDVDMVSLFPSNTYKNRENGLRVDLVEMLKDLEPSFIRFPGGCIVEGDPLTTAYRWKDTIGDVAERKQNTNLWIGTREHPYYQSYGLGFYEYFLLSEDLGAEPVPIVNAGLSCQARSAGKSGVLCSDAELETYIQDALDLIEFANGDITTEWGAKRAEMGHPEPFDLKYIGIGNENWDAVYFKRYTEFVEPIRAKYPDIKLITTSGPVASGNLNDYAWKTLNIHRNDKLKYADLIDEHYYNPADWFLSNTNRYDSYERNYVDVFLGEYAAKANTLYAAVAEAAFMTGLERNSDVVKMASYAPLFGNLLSRQWSPDMIYFNNSTAFGSINYYVQKMFSTNRGDYTLKSELEVKQASLSSISGKVGLGTWLTSAVYDDVKVVNNVTGEILYESNFNNADGWKATSEGEWGIFDDNGNSVFGQSNITYPTNGAPMGSASYIGETDWTNYTYTLRAKKLNGAEGFLIPFAVEDGENFYHWNLGGWGNTQTCIEQAQGGIKTIVSDSKNIPIKTNTWYDIKIVVSPEAIKCYLGNSLIHTVTLNQVYTIYETVSKDEETGELIIKIVNAGEVAQVTVNLKNVTSMANKATLQVLTGENKSDENTVLKPEKIIPVESALEVKESFDYLAPGYSVSIIRIPVE